MPDAVLKIGAIVDKETVQSGMQDSQDAVQSSTAAMATSFQEMQGRATGAWKRISDDTKAAASIVSSESLRIAESTKAAAAAQQELRAALTLVKSANVDTAQSTAVLAAAQDNARAKAMQLKAAQDAIAESSKHVIPEMAASSAAIRSFEGAVPIRAVERFIGTTLGLGPLLTAAFPVVGAVDLGIMVAHVGEKIYEVGKAAAMAGANIGAAFGDLHDRSQVTNDDLRVTDDKLKDMAAKLEGNPGNGLQTALDEAIKRADTLLVSLKADQKAIEEIFKANAVGAGGSFLSGVAGTGKQTEELLADNKELIKAVRTAREQYAAELLNAKTPEAQKAAGDRNAAAIHDAFQKQVTAYQVEVARLKKEESDSASAALVNGANRNSDAGIVNNSAKIANLNGVIDTLKDRLTEQTISQAIATDSERVGQDKQGEHPAGAENKAAQQELRNIETQFAQMNTKLPEEALAFWSRFNGTFKEGSTEYLHVIEQVNKYTAEFQKSLKDGSKLSGEMKKLGEESSAAVPESVTRSLEEFNKHIVEQAEDITRTGARWDGYGRSVLKGQEILTAHNLAMQEMAIKAAEAAHALSPVAAAQQLAALHTAAHTAKLKELEAELAKLQAEGANLKPGDKGYAQNQDKQQQAQNSITQELGSGQQQKVQDQTAVANAIAKPYLSAFDTINNGWLKVQNDLIAGNGKVGQDLRRMALQMTQDLAKHFEQAIANHARMEIQQSAQHRAAAALNATTDQAAAATSVQVSALAAIKMQAHAAANAAGKAWSAFASIPIVGPELGAVAAAATYAGVMALAAFEKGGIVGGSPGMAVPILAHSGERVLTTTQTNNFERMVNNSSNSGTMNMRMGDSHFHGSGGSAGDFHGQFQQHERKIIGSLRQWHREGKLAFAQG